MVIDIDKETRRLRREWQARTKCTPCAKSEEAMADVADGRVTSTDTVYRMAEITGARFLWDDGTTAYFPSMHGTFEHDVEIAEALLAQWLGLAPVCRGVYDNRRRR